MNSFKSYHPIVNFTYFAFVIVFNMIFMNPICLAISLISSFAYSIMAGKSKALKFNIGFIVPIILIAIIVNPLFSHEGITILGYLPSGNPITKESILYGVGTGIMLGSVICWFSCYNLIMTSDKFIYIFGRITPSLSLILSMVLRFVPLFKQRLKAISNSQKAIGKDISQGSIIQRAKNGLNILSIMITWSLENAIETSESMKSRGYGLKGRTAFSIYTMDYRDKRELILMLILGGYIIAGSILGGIDFTYYPSTSPIKIDLFSVSIYTAYLLLCITPIIIEGREELKWKYLKSRI